MSGIVNPLQDYTLLGTASGATTTVGPVIWTGTFTRFFIDYFIAGYNGGTPVGRMLFGAASISTTALTNGSSLDAGPQSVFAAPTNALSIPGCPLAVALSAIARRGTALVRGASGALKTYEVQGANGNASVSAAPTFFRAVGSFSDLSTNLPLQRMQLSVYDTLTATAVSAQTFLSGTYLTVWGAA